MHGMAWRCMALLPSLPGIWKRIRKWPCHSTGRELSGSGDDGCIARSRSQLAARTSDSSSKARGPRAGLAWVGRVPKREEPAEAEKFVAFCQT